MNERWERHSTEEQETFYELQSPFGLLTLKKRFREGEFVARVGCMLLFTVVATDWNDACREAERIIADRCRDTLGLLGET